LPDDSSVQIVLTADAGSTTTPRDEDSFPDQHIIEKMVRLASEMLARSGDGNNHTVAASLYADDGAIYNGINLYHFTGGPCAEIVALARLASAHHAADGHFALCLPPGRPPRNHAHCLSLER